MGNEDAPDANRVARDYATLRLEIVANGDIKGLADSYLASIAADFHGAQQRLLAALGPSQWKAECEATVNFEKVLSSVQRRLSDVRARETSQRQQQQNSDNQNTTSLAKLPKITIKSFDGGVDQWVSFIQLFDSLIHSRTNLSDVEKLHYLLSCVQGTAYDLIKAYPLTNDSYLLAYNSLVKYYNRKWQIATAYYEKILGCVPAKGKSAAELERVARTFSENLSVLERFGLPDKNFMLVHLLWSKLDSATKVSFQMEHNSDDVPNLADVQKFLERSYRAMNVTQVPGSSTSSSGTSSSGTSGSGVSGFSQNRPAPAKGKVQNYKPKASFVVSSPSCARCSGPHNLASCEDFLKLNTHSRFDFVKEKGLCILCFSPSHTVKVCRRDRCAKCNFSHNDLLHFGDKEEESRERIVAAQPSREIVLASVSPLKENDVLFSTAVLLARRKDGSFQPVRALLDSASACNFITRACAESLGLDLRPSSSTVSGIGHTLAEPGATVSAELSSRDFKNNRVAEAYVLPSICSPLPVQPVDSSGWVHIRGLSLADPGFAHPGTVDLLLNADFFASSLLPGLIRGDVGQPSAINTVFGWVLMGGLESEPVPLSRSRSCRSRFSRDNQCLVVTNLSLDNSIRRFWELENIAAPQGEESLSHLERQCEQLFVSQHSRTEEGRFVVPLPFGTPSIKPTFVGSRTIALKRFLHLEKKLFANPELRKSYVAFMDDYAACHHLEEATAPVEDCGNFYYIPHHGILRPDSVSTPLRVVFDASAKDAQGVSLNDTLLAGPKLQTNIFDVLLRFRWHSVVFTGDVKQMYRQILVPDEDAEYQRILWRPSPVGPVKDFKLRTVTYGVASAPYQALRTISQLAHVSSAQYPHGSAILSRDIYVDDVVSGADSLEEALAVKAELSDILSAGGFHLRKWASNEEEFCRDVPLQDLYSSKFIEFTDSCDLSLKILGLLWLPQADHFSFRVHTEDRRCTKRTILSEISRIYDPIGFLAPVTFLAKYLIQILWTAGVEWDEDAPQNVSSEWAKFKLSLSSLSAITIPRRMIQEFVSLELHGFCDASERGYCAVLYCRILAADGSCTVSLCCAKSRVAPLRRLSVPRLELQAAVLLADLMAATKKALSPFRSDFTTLAWSDSTVALAWIKSCPSRWQTFVANRVSHIQEHIAPDCWRHVPTGENPADLGSRGLLPGDIVGRELWWSGPSWLSESSDAWPQQPADLGRTEALPEARIVSLVVSTEPHVLDSLIHRFSSLETVKRVLAYVLRFTYNARRNKTKAVGALVSSETQNALLVLIKHAQDQAFPEEIERLQDGRPNLLSKGLRKLSPFLDDAGLLRVGGRLANASVAFEAKHPLLLPRQHRLTELLIESCHQRYMHPGVQTLQNILAQSFWILSPKRAIRSVVSKCMKCFRVNPRPAIPPVMGNLPSFRIGALKPFSSAAIDFGGPFDIALGRGRGVRTYKAYICVFVCTSTKAIHIELASELSTEAFLAALKRFVARRGRCSRLVSDQGRNFIGASNYFASIMKNAAEKEEIKFSFNPPGSPHFNGLAEAGIKSVKTHLARVVGSQRLTFEEFSTVLTQVEAMLNSRPLTPLSTDTADLTVLTPGHFLTLEPLTALPEENFLEQTISPLHRWKMLQRMHQDFWKRWSLEYMHTLQQKSKWCKDHTNVCVGTLVLIVDEQTRPALWKLGRIEALHPGADDICRVVTVRTATGCYQRPVVKLCPLPIS